MGNKVYIVTVTGAYGPEVDTNVSVRDTLEKAQEKFEEFIKKEKECFKGSKVIKSKTRCEIYNEYKDYVAIVQILEREVK